MSNELPVKRFFDTPPILYHAELRGQSVYDGQQLLVMNFRTADTDHLEALTIEAALELASSIRELAVNLGYSLPE